MQETSTCHFLLMTSIPIWPRRLVRSLKIAHSAICSTTIRWTQQNSVSRK